MFRKHPCIRLYHFWFLLTAFGIFLSPWIFLFITPPLQFGLYVRSESAAFGLFAIAAITGFGLSGLLLSGRGQKYLCHFSVLIPFVIGFLSAIRSPFVPAPMLSWFGVPNPVTGILWFFAITTLIIGGRIIFDSFLNQALCINILLASLIMFFLSFVTNQDHGIFPSASLYYYVEFFSFAAIALIGISASQKTRKKQYIPLLVSFIMIAFSFNRSAIGGLLLTAAFLLIIYFTKLNVRVYGAVFCAAIIIGVPVIALFLTNFFEENPFPIRGWSSFWQRGYLIKIILQDIWTTKNFLGYGWGRFSDIILNNSLNLPQSLANIAGGNELKIVDFNPHNQITEAFLGGGILAALLSGLMPIMPILFCDKSKVYLAILNGAVFSATAATWFDTPMTIAFTSLAISAFMKTTKQFKIINQLAPAVFFSMSLLLAFGAFTTIKIGMANNAVPHTYISKILKTDNVFYSPGTQNFITYSGAGGHFLSYHIRNQSKYLINKHNKKEKLSDQDITMCNCLLDAAEKIASKGSMVFVVSVLQLYEVLFTESEKDERIKNLLSNRGNSWLRAVEQLSLVGAKRTDLLEPFFKWCIARKDNEAVRYSINTFFSRASFSKNDELLKSYWKKCQ